MVKGRLSTAPARTAFAPIKKWSAASTLGGRRPSESCRRLGKHAIHLLKATALGLEPDEPEGDSAEDPPGTKIEEGRPQGIDSRLGVDVVGPAGDPSQSAGSSYIANVADAVTAPHAARAQPGRRHLRHVMCDDRIVAAAEKYSDQDHDVE